MNTAFTAVRQQQRRWLGRCVVIVAGALAINSTVALAANLHAYVPSNFVNEISVVDLSHPTATPETFSTTSTATNTAFYGVALSARDGMLYITDEINDTVFQINTATGATVHTYSVGSGPHGIAVDTSGRHVYVANPQSSDLTIIDTSTGAIKSVDFGNLSGLSLASPAGVALNLSGTRAYVTDKSSGQRLCQVNTTSPPDSVTDGDCIAVGAVEDDGADPEAVAVSPDGTRVYVVNRFESTVSVVDALNFTVIRTFLSPISAGLNGIAIAASGKRAYIGTSTGQVLVIDPALADEPNQNPVLHVIESPDVSNVSGVSISPDGTHLLAVDFDFESLHFINIVGDADTVDASVHVTQSPIAIGQFTETNLIFVGGFEG